MKWCGARSSDTGSKDASIWNAGSEPGPGRPFSLEETKKEGCGTEKNTASSQSENLQQFTDLPQYQVIKGTAAPAKSGENCFWLCGKRVYVLSSANLSLKGCMNPSTSFTQLRRRKYALQSMFQNTCFPPIPCLCFST